LVEPASLLYFNASVLLLELLELDVKLALLGFGHSEAPTIPVTVSVMMNLLVRVSPSGPDTPSLGNWLESLLRLDMAIGISM
jgi:hypothetical protein